MMARKSMEEPLELANSLLEQARTANQTREAVASRNEAWVRGIQDDAMVGMHPFMAELARTYLTGRDEPATIYNITRPLVKTKVSNLIPVEPNLIAVPSGPGETPRARADRSLELIRAWQQSPDVWPLEERLRCEHYVVTVGAAWVATVWNPMAGPLDPLGNPQGDVMVRWCPLQEVYTSPGARSSRSVRWLIERRMLSRREAEFEFPVDAHGVSTEGRFEQDDREDGALTDAAQNDGRRQGAEGADEMVPVYWLWMRPYRGFPFGRLVVWSGSVLLSAGPVPYADSSGIVWPWVLRLADNIVPQGLYSDGIDDLIEPQRELNDVITKRGQWMSSSMNPALLNPMGAGVKQEEYLPRPGAVINVVGTMMPRFMEVPEIPGSLFAVEGAAMETMQMVSGMSDAMRGEGVDASSGRAVAYSAHLSKRTLKVAESLYMSSFAAIMQNLLRLARIYYPEERMIRSLGPGGTVEVAVFKRQDYDLMAEVWIPAYESVPMDRGSRMQEMIELQGVDAFNPENPGGAALLQELNYRTPGAEALRAQDVHRRLARHEHVRFENDPFDPVDVQPFHDHEQHLAEHNRYMNTIDFAERIRQDPQLLQRLMSHVSEHEVALVEQAQAGAAMPGAPEGRGGQKGAIGAPPPAAGNEMSLESPEEQDPLPEGAEVESEMESVATGETR